MIFYAKDYGQTGGFAHGSDEQSIMQEIHANGPVIVSFAASAIPEFIYNNGQIIVFGMALFQGRPVCGLGHLNDELLIS